MYTCIVVGDGATLWGGTAFNCTNTANQTILRHSQYATGISGECNNGAIMARSVTKKGNCYTSELSVNISATLNNKTITCVHNKGLKTIGTSLLTVISGNTVTILLSHINYYVTKQVLIHHLLLYV